MFGYGLTGNVREHCLPIFFGSGANGKSTLLGIILELMGDYGMKADPDLLISKNRNHPTEQADLFRKRMVICNETEDGCRLDEPKVKDLTGGDRIRARRMREDFWEFKPTHKIILPTNHKPIIRGTDNGIWRRLKLICFGVTFSEDKQDKELSFQLRKELPGILNWCVQGCLDWQKVGLKEPFEVQVATNEYQSDMDIFWAFLKEECIIEKNVEVSSSDLYQRYQNWCSDNGYKPYSQKRLAQLLQECECTSDRYTCGLLKSRKLWRGIALRSHSEP